MDNEFIVSKVLSNNVIICKRKNKLYVLTGKGIGFGKSKGDIILNESSIEKKFVAIDDEDREDYAKILQNTDKKVVAVSEEIINMASQRLKEPLSSHIHVGLADHINFAIRRLSEGIDIVNPFLVEIQTLYPIEYSIAEECINLVKERLNIILPESETGFIALHLYSARVNQSVSDSLKYTKLVKEIINFIQKELDISINEKSLEYARLISHLRYALQRVDRGKTFENFLSPNLEKKLKQEFKVSKKVCTYIEEKLDKPVPESEIGYIAVHIARLINNI
ncbi:transcriptional antiterminator, BglG family [Caloramator quimbayensis]|uniref:Transcriptional antiterminator, BglG family n=1 Tax=Caloramator quimbayensis TaxID=1147123 RepID=A0A1T4WRB8_9CLOT|nr:PRD domain-containing protein [Caloramator quimbayensis]SKA79161.1 transcriptional antiterminator, BglG family [Caloramator quimbayensis]